MKDDVNTSLDNSENIPQKNVNSAREHNEESRRFFAETVENISGTVSNIGLLIKKNAIKFKDDAVSFFSMRRAGMMLLLESFNGASFGLTIKGAQNIINQAKNAFTSAGAMPHVNNVMLSAQFAEQAVAPEVEQALVLQFNELQNNIRLARDNSYTEELPTKALEQLRQSPECSVALSNAFSEAGFVYTGREEEIVCMPCAVAEITERFNVLQESVASAQQLGTPTSQIQSLFKNAGFVYDPNNTIGNGEAVTISVMDNISEGTKEVPIAGQTAHNDEDLISRKKFPGYEAA